jgi:2-amino-4,5-dihydroxy-6-oxo-7-(phosphonooxy)heptanoate synthase
VHGDNGFTHRLRLARLCRPDARGLLVVPLDHAVGAGSPGRPADLDGLVARLAAGGADAVVLHKGAVRRVRPDRFRRLGLIVQLNAGTGRGPDPDAKYPVATVKEAAVLGADAVSVHVNLASPTEGAQIGHLAAVAGDCARWGMPLLAMMYVRGPDVVDGTAPALVAHAVTVAAELGADLVKTALPAAPDAVAALTAACPVPVLAAGGPVGGDADAAVARLADAVRAGARGVAVGRLVFTAPDPGEMVRRLRAVLPERTAVPAQ